MNNYPIRQSENRTYFCNDLSGHSDKLGLTTINTLSIGRLSDYGLEKLKGYISTMQDINAFQFTGEKDKLIKKAEAIEDVYNCLKIINSYMCVQWKKPEGCRNSLLIQGIEKINNSWYIVIEVVVGNNEQQIVADLNNIAVNKL